MALPTLPGQTGYKAFLYSSNNGKAIAKMTDKNHLETLIGADSPTPYDRGVIDIYTQTSLEANDFLAMVNKTEPLLIDGDEFTWKLRGAYRFPKLVHIPEATLNDTDLGQDGRPFTLVFDTDYFSVNHIITANQQHGDKLMVIKGPEPYNGAFLYHVVLTGADVTPTTTADLRFIQEGYDYDVTDNVIGEFDQELPGLPGTGDYYQMVESISAGYGQSHKITGWADSRYIGKDGNGNPLDLIVYDKYKMNEQGKIVPLGSRWEPFIERRLKDEMLRTRIKRMLYGAGGDAQTLGNRQEVKKITEGIIPKLRRHANYLPLNKGEFSLPLLRDLFGKLFYRRVPMSQRRVKLYTNEAGMRLFRQASKDDALASGLTFVADSRFIDGSGQNMTVNYGFEGVVTMETGKIEVAHLMELDLPEMNSDFGGTNYSAPVFIAFDISNANGGLNHIREVRQRNNPTMTWGYINGRRHHLGHAASKGFEAASMFNGYEMFVDDRSDIFIEDYSRCVFIEELPFFG